MLRYWLAALRLEEALSVRPQARRTTHAAIIPRLEQPTPGQDYFKVPLDAALAGLLGKQTQLERAFDGELCGFFETWLDAQYRRGEDDGELSHLLCFPVLHLPKGELAGLLRCAVRLRFGSGESKVFRAPTRAERQRKVYPSPPDEVRLTRTPKVEAAWPFFIDTRLLRQPLGVSSESIDALFEALRALSDASELDLLSLLTVTLELSVSGDAARPETVEARAERLKKSVAGERCDVEAWLARLLAAARRLLEQSGSRAQAYPVGIVIDGTQTRTTWHLQRELNALLDADGERWKLDSPLGAYLTGRARAAGVAPQRALFPGPGLTASQRAAAEHFWGSSLSAVQGPPGTGKTSLILHLSAEALLRQVEPVVDGGRMNGTLFLIVSSNNRAVDNVIEPLSGGDLPLALRAGSRQACEQHLASGLRRTLTWLKRAEGAGMGERMGRFTQASEELRRLRGELDRVLAPRRQALARAAERARLRCELESLEPRDAEAPAAQTPSAGPLALDRLSPVQSKAIMAALHPLEKRLRALSKLCEVAPGSAPLAALNRHFKRTKKQDLPRFEQALAGAGLRLELPLPPPPLVSAGAEQQLERWEEASELCLSRLGELRAGIERLALRAQQAEQRLRLRRELEALGAEAEPVPESVDHEPLSRALFDAAVALREAWAAQHATELGKAISTALRTVEQERSLRSLFRNDPDAARWLCRLFNIWGSTLLSLGNCFPTDEVDVARVVIDEAGQCHPAHAISGLLRAESALVIGDVHQLAPVIELGADDEARLLRAYRLESLASALLPYRVHENAFVSTQSIADRAVARRLTLEDHFRCQHEIIALSDALCDYGLTVHTARADRAAQAAFLTHPVMLVDVHGEQSPLAGSWCNELELSETLALVESLLDHGVQTAEIAVITPYRGQLERLRRGLAERRIPLEHSAELSEGGASATQRAGVALGTVHRFQGGERSIVLFSSVVTHPASLGFLNARPNLLNVAISRARHHFICLGHAGALRQGARTRLIPERARALDPAAYGRGTQAPLFAAPLVAGG